MLAPKCNSGAPGTLLVEEVMSPENQGRAVGSAVLSFRRSGIEFLYGAPESFAFRFRRLSRFVRFVIVAFHYCKVKQFYCN
jgi:hypothetical protein